eukprot:scaffold20712_cov14-Tisochrysis_lutea.AAC.1
MCLVIFPPEQNYLLEREPLQGKWSPCSLCPKNSVCTLKGKEKPPTGSREISWASFQLNSLTMLVRFLHKAPQGKHIFAWVLRGASSKDAHLISWHLLN